MIWETFTLFAWKFHLFEHFIPLNTFLKYFSFIFSRRSSGYGRSYGDRGPAKDPRPTSDKGFKNRCIKELVEVIYICNKTILQVHNYHKHFMISSSQMPVLHPLQNLGYSWSVSFMNTITQQKGSTCIHWNKMHLSQGFSQGPSSLSFRHSFLKASFLDRQNILWRIFNFGFRRLNLYISLCTITLLGHGWSVHCPLLSQ